MKRIAILLAAAIAAVSFSAFADAPLSDAEADAGAVTACMKEAKSDSQVSTCILGLVAMKAIGRGATAAAAPPQVIVQKADNGRTGWDVFAGMVMGVAQFAKEAFQTVAPVAAQVYVARTNAHTQEVVAGFQRDTQIATVQGFTTMGGQIQTAGTAGYPYVQAPGATTSTTNTLSGTGVLGSGTYTAPVTTSTDSHNNPAPTVVTCTGSPPVCTR